jgi:hypothetical protein
LKKPSPQVSGAAPQPSEVAEAAHFRPQAAKEAESPDWVPRNSVSSWDLCFVAAPVALTLRSRLSKQDTASILQFLTQQHPFKIIFVFIVLSVV